jgi:hypothetical protein
MKRIRSKLERARILTAEAYTIAEAGHAHLDLVKITARAADSMDDIRRDLEQLDERDRVTADRIARQLLGEPR